MYLRGLLNIALDVLYKRNALGMRKRGGEMELVEFCV